MLEIIEKKSSIFRVVLSWSKMAVGASAHLEQFSHLEHISKCADAPSVRMLQVGRKMYPAHSNCANRILQLRWVKSEWERFSNCADSPTVLILQLCPFSNCADCLNSDAPTAPILQLRRFSNCADSPTAPIL